MDFSFEMLSRRLAREIVDFLINTFFADYNKVVDAEILFTRTGRVKILMLLLQAHFVHSFLTSEPDVIFLYVFCRPLIR